MPSGQDYPWDEWLRPGQGVFTRGETFTSSPHTFRQLLSEAARKRNLIPDVRVRGSSVYWRVTRRGIDEVTLLTPELAREVRSIHRPQEVNMSTEAEALERVRSERDLIRRIDDNVFRLLEAGHGFSPAGLVKDNRTSLSEDALVGRTPGPPVTHELTEVVVGDIVWDEPDIPTEEGKALAQAELQPYLDAMASDLEDLSAATRVNVVPGGGWDH
jgi:hypothetical protein